MKPRPGLSGSIGAAQVAVTMQIVRELGHDDERVLGIAGVRRDQLQDPHARLPPRAEFALWDACVAVTGDPLIGLRIGARMAAGSMGAFEYLLRNTATLRAVIEQATRFARVLDELICVSLLEEGGRAYLRLWRGGGVPRLSESMECLFAVNVRFLKNQLATDSRHEARFDHEIHFMHKALGDRAIYTELLGCKVRFEGAHDQLVFDRALLDLPLPRADAKLGAVLEDHMLRLHDALPREEFFVRSARTALLAALGEGEPSLDRLAKALHTSSRTLRRRLAEHGLAYQALLDDVRREHALREIGRREEPLEVLAKRLGFTEVSSFYRAFKRWTGQTPAQYRRSQRAVE